MADQSMVNILHINGGGPDSQQAQAVDPAQRAEIFRQLTARLTDSTESDLLFFAGDIDKASLAMFVTAIRGRKLKRKNVTLILTTIGGDPHCAYRIIKRLQQSYPNGAVTIFVHSTCASAGTLMVVGGHSVVMSDSAELGPLDIQIAKTDDLINRMSGLTPTKAMATLRQQALSCFEDIFLRVLQGSGFRISVKTASEIAVNLTAGLYEPIYAQVNPFHLGEVQRDNEIAQKYGQRLDRGNLQDGGLSRLINEYPAHEFVINREEAKQHIFNRVREPTDDESALAEFMEESIERAFSATEPIVSYLCRPLQAVPDKGEALNETVQQANEANPPRTTGVRRRTRSSGARAAVTARQAENNGTKGQTQRPS